MDVKKIGAAVLEWPGFWVMLGFAVGYTITQHIVISLGLGILLDMLVLIAIRVSRQAETTKKEDHASIQLSNPSDGWKINEPRTLLRLSFRSRTSSLRLTYTKHSKQ